MTAIFFALGNAWRRSGLLQWDHAKDPLNVLMTFADQKLVADAVDQPWDRVMLDSGAYSAWNSGRSIDMGELIAATKDPRFTESVALDVIGDADASMKNALAMKAAGSPAFPVFHYGDPWEHLAAYKEVFGRVGLSCRFGEPTSASVAWLEQCFARAWPCCFHSFGWTGAEALARFPFDTADSTSWMVPQMWGQWRSFGRQHNRHFGFPSPNTDIKTSGTIHMTGEVFAFLKIQRFLAWRWGQELAQCRSRTHQSTSAAPTRRPSTPPAST